MYFGAFEGLAGLFPNQQQHRTCFTGGRIDTALADRLVSGLKGLLSQSYGNRLFWREKVGKSWKLVNSVRWGATHDVNQNVLENFVEMRQFLAELMTTEGKDNKTARQLLVSCSRPCIERHSLP